MIPHATIRTVAGAVFALAVISTPARAQGVLGRARDRARQALSGNQAPAAPERCTAGQPVGGDFVVRYIRALQAREAELRRLARENSSVGRYFAAMVRQDSVERRRIEFDAGTGPDWTRSDALMARMQRGDVAAAQELGALRQSIDQQVDLPTDANFDAVSAATARMDTVMMQGGGFSKCDLMAVGEAIPGGVAQIANDPSAEIAAMGLGALNAEGIAAVRAHRVELARLLKIHYKSDAMLARGRAERARQDSLNNVMTAWQACYARVMGPAASPGGGMTKAQQDSIHVWSQRADDAQKRGDQAAMMALAMKIQAAMAPGAQGQAMAQLRAQQECGAQPGMPQ